MPSPTLKTVTGTFTGPDGNGIPCTVRSVLSQACTVPGTQEVVPNAVRVVSNGSGAFSLSLYSNGDLTPSPTTYAVTAIGTVDGVPVVGTWTIIVPTSAGPFEISNILALAPPVPSPPGALDSQVVHLALPETITGVKHFSAAPVFDAGFTVSAGAVSFPVNAVLDAAINSLSASKLTGANGLPDAVLSTNVNLLNAIQTVTAVKTYSAAPVFSLGASFPSGAGIVTFGGGDDVQYFQTGTAWEMDARQGTAASPITTGSGPTFKISRTESISATTMPGGNGANNQGNAGLWVSATGDTNNETQISAIMGSSKNASTKARTANAINIDACGIQGFGEIQAGGTGNGIGAYFEGRVDSTLGGANGLEVRTNNNTGSNHTFNATGLSTTTGIWLTPGSSTAGNINGVAISTGVTNSCQWDTGLGFTVVGGISSVKTTTFDDESNSVNSILIAGTHTRAIGIKTGAGPVLIGHTNATDAATNASALFEVFSNNQTSRGVINNQGGSATAEPTYKIGNSSGSAEWFIAGTAGHFLTGTATGDTGYIVNTAAKMYHIGGTLKVLTVTQDNKLGHFAVTPVVQPATTGTTTGFTAGAGTAVNDASTFTGGTGSTAYRISDVVLALKQLGLMAA